MAAIRLYWDITNQEFVASTINAATISLPKFVLYDTVPIEVQVLERNPSGGISAPYTILTSATGPSAIRMGVGTPGSTEYTFADLTFNATGNYWSGNLDLATASMIAAVGSAQSLSTKFSLRSLVTGYNSIIKDLTIYNRVISGAGVSPTPTDTYLTVLEASATYVKKVGGSGDVISITSPSGQYTTTLYIDDSGAFHSDTTTNF